VISFRSTIALRLSALFETNKDALVLAVECGLLAVWVESKKLGLRGRSRVEWVLGKPHLDFENDESKLQRLLRLKEACFVLANRLFWVVGKLENPSPQGKPLRNLPV